MTRADQKEMAFPEEEKIENINNNAFIYLIYNSGGGELQPTADCSERHSTR